MLLGCLVVSILSVLALTPAAAQPGTLWPLLMLMGGVMGGLYALSLSLLGQAFLGPEQATANTAYIMVFEIGVVLGPALAGLAMQLLGGATLPWAAAVPLVPFAGTLPVAALAHGCPARP